MMLELSQDAKSRLLRFFVPSVCAAMLYEPLMFFKIGNLSLVKSQEYAAPCKISETIRRLGVADLACSKVYHLTSVEY